MELSQASGGESSFTERQSFVRPYRWDLTWLFLIAVFLRVAFLWAAVGQVRSANFFDICPDTAHYVEAARALISGDPAYESTFMIFGPGFPVLLSLFFRLLGQSPYPFLLTQILLSGLSCLLIYRLGIRLTGRRDVGMIAGLLSAFSITSICLSSVILSDIVFLFLLLLSFDLFLVGLDTAKLWRFLVSGIVMAAAILIRSIGQFLPLIFMLIAISYLWRRPGAAAGIHVPARRRVLQVGLWLAIVFSTQTAWVVRNYIVNGVAVPAITSVGGPANVAAMTLERLTGRPYRDIENDWITEYMQGHNLKTVSFAEHCEVLHINASIVFREHPGQAVKTYLGMVWENFNDIDYIHRMILPKFNNSTVPWEEYVKEHYLNLIPFILAMSGLITLLVLRNYRAAFILGLLYLYFALMTGFTRWQGSRLFLPAQSAWPILLAVFVSSSFRALGWIVQRTTDILGRIRAISAVRTWAAAKPWLPFWAFLSGLALSLVVLFRSFIFSNSMLNSNDILGFGLASRKLVEAHFSSAGWLPAWDPYVKCGVPFIEGIHGGIFYPLSIVDYLGYVPRMIGFNFLLHFLLSGAFTYLAARSFRLSRPASLVAGAAYAFSPLMISWIAPGHDGKIYFATLFPLIVFFLNRLLKQGRIRDLMGLGIVFGAAILTPHLQMALYAGIFIAAFTVYRLVQLLLKTGKLRATAFRGLLVALATVLALMLSAVQWYPSLIYVTGSSPRSYEQIGLEYASTFSLHPEEAIATAFPEFCGLDRQPEERTYWGRNSFKDNSESVGVVTFALAVLGLLLPGSRNRFWWGAVAALALVYALGSNTPVFAFLINHFPLLGYMRAPSTIMFLFAFASAMLAASAVHRLSRPTLSDRPRNRRLKYLLVSGPVIMFVVAVLMTLKGRGFLAYYAQALYPSLLEATEFGRVRWEHALANLPYLKAGMWWAWLMVTATSAAILLYLRTYRTRLLLVGLAVLIVVANGRFCTRFIRLVDAHHEYDYGPVARYLEEHAGNDRVVGFAINQSQYRVGWYPIQSTIGFHGKEPAWYYKLHGENPARNYFRARFSALTGTRFVVFPRSPRDTLNVDTLGPIRLDTAAYFDDCIVFENKNAFPRAYLVDSIQLYDSLRLVHVETVFGKTDLRHVALLEERPELPLHHFEDTDAAARIESYDTDSVVVSVTAPSNRLLILTDNWFDAWHAYVDGRESKIYRAYGSFRAVEIPAGSKQVVFKYHSRQVFWGGMFSLIGLGIIVVSVSVPAAVQIKRRLDTHKQKPPH